MILNEINIAQFKLRLTAEIDALSKQIKQQESALMHLHDKRRSLESRFTRLQDFTPEQLQSDEDRYNEEGKSILDLPYFL